MAVIIQYNTGKCETIPLNDARRLWCVLTGEKRGPAGDKRKARSIRRWFFPPDDAPESFKRHQEIEAGDPPTLDDSARGWMGAYDQY